MTEQQLTQNDLVSFILRKIRLSKSPTSVRPNSRAKMDRVVQVDLPKTGGIYCHFENEKYPQKGFPYHDTVEKIDEIKKVFMGLLYGFNSFKGKWLLGVFFLLFKKRILASLDKLVGNFHTILKSHFLDPFRYCTAIRELYSAFDKEDKVIRDIVCMVLEFDDAYRYRFQYAFGQLNHEEFEKNHLKELNRLLTILEQKENDERLRKTWGLMKKVLFVGFFFKGVRKKTVKVVAKLNTQNIRMDEADTYYAKQRHNY